MNLFKLDHDLQKSAEYHCDKHLLKQILEATQCLAAALDRWDLPSYITSRATGKPYKITHENHPVTRWVGSHQGNFWYTQKYALALCEEYTWRYGKAHACESKLLGISGINLGDMPKGSTTHPQCFGEDNISLQKEDPVEGHRLYYNVVKRKSVKMTWKNRKEPYWYKNFSLEVFKDTGKYLKE